MGSAQYLRRTLTRSHLLPILIVAIVGAGALYEVGVILPRARAEAIHDQLRDLAAWADVRRRSVEHWVARLEEQARSLAEVPTIKEAVSDWTPAGRQRAVAVLAVMTDSSNGVHLRVAGTNREHLGLRTGAELLGASELERLVLAQGRSVSRMLRDGRGQPWLWLGVPVRGMDGTVGGVLTLTENCSVWLFPFLQASPGAQTGEALLTRADGANVYYLSPRRDGQMPSVARAAMPLNLAAAVAADAGDTTGHFRDYNDVPVLAAARRVAGTDWALVVKMSEREALAAYRRRALGEVAVTALGLLLVGALALALWWAGRMAAEADAAGEERLLAEFMEQAHDAIVVVNTSGVIVAANRAAQAMYGEDLLHRTAGALRPAETRDEAYGHIKAALGGEPQLYESINLDAAGTPLPVEVSLSAVTVRTERFVVAVVRDIRDRKVNEARLERLASVRRVQSAVAAIMVREHDPEVLLSLACEAVVREGGLPFAWIAAERGDGVLYPRASAGAPERYFEAYHATPATDGPTRQAIDQRRTAVRAIPQDGEVPEPEAILRAAGCRAWIATPLVAQGAVLGALVVCARDPAMMDAEIVRLVKEIAADLAFALDAAAHAGAQRRAEALLRVVVDGTTDAIFVKDREGRYLLANLALERLLGRPASEIIGRNDAQLFPQRSGTAIAAKDRAILVGGTAETYVEQVDLPDGSTRTFETTKGVWHGPDGAALGTFGVARDVTEERRLADERARLAAAIEQSGEAAIITDAGGSIQYVNPAFERITGYSRAEAVGQKPSLLKSGAQSLEVYRGMWEQVLRGEVWSGEFVNRRRDGTLYTAEVTISPVRDAAGVVTGLVGLQRDVTRLRELDAQLRQSQKLEAVGQLTGGLAHDFNNLLQVVLANASLLAAELDGAEPGLRGLVNEIQVAAGRGSGMVRKLLAFSRKERIEPVAADLRKVVEEFMRVLRRVLPETIAVELAAGVAPTVMLDGGAFEQVVLNLATNARDAMPDGGRLLLAIDEVRCDADDAARIGVPAAGAYAVMSVTDTGSGMSPAVLARVFDPFFTTKEPGRGTGLGLPMVLGITQLHRGHVTVDSVPGAGTTVRLYLPTTTERPVAAGATEVPVTPGRGETILVVEDEPGVLRASVRALRKLGFVALGAVNGIEGLAMLREHPEVDCVLTDRVMPQMGGIEFAGQARREGFRAPFVLASGYVPEQRQDLPEGICAVVPKPWTTSLLAEAIQQALRSRSSVS